MMKLVFSFVFVLAGLAAGIAAGSFMKPQTTEENLVDGETDAAKLSTASDDTQQSAEVDTSGTSDETEFVKLNNQFVVPVISEEAVRSLVVVSLSVEVAAGEAGMVYSSEPKLRDAFLQALFDHANIGGFSGVFTRARTMEILRSTLTASARRVLGESVSGVLITDLARQDI